MYPGLPSSLSGAYKIGPDLDEEVQGWPICRRGKLWGVWLDDTTPDLLGYIKKAQAKYVSIGKTVLVAVAPGDAGKHYRMPGVVECYERYVYGMGVPPAAWGSCPRGYRAYCVQWRWPGTVDTIMPTLAQRTRLLAGVLLRRPTIILKF